MRILAGVLALVLAACSQEGGDEGEGATEITQVPNASTEQTELVPGLDYRTTSKGYGRVAAPGDAAEVHYTGWLFDAEAEDGRGEKFDSSLDRGETFTFPLGAGRVIRGWDEGVAGMLIGEKRELVIAPEMAYGERGRPPVIPPNSTLLFEVELIGLQGPDDGQE